MADDVMRAPLAAPSVRYAGDVRCRRKRVDV